MHLFSAFIYEIMQFFLLLLYICDLHTLAITMICEKREKKKNSPKTCFFFASHIHTCFTNNGKHNASREAKKNSLFVV